MRIAKHCNSTETTTEWTRVSSYKPHLISAGVILGLTVLALGFWGSAEIVRFTVITAAILLLGLLALNFKVVHKCGEVYRVSSLFYAEALTREDVCLTVDKPGPLWTATRIHLRKPARFGWKLSYVPVRSAASNRRAFSKE